MDLLGAMGPASPPCYASSRVSFHLVAGRSPAHLPSANHLDRTGREHVMNVLRGWNGCVIVASHDRTLLEDMDAIVELSSLGAKTYGGPFSAYHMAKQAELANAEDDLARAQRNKVITKARAQQAAQRKARTDRQGKQLRASSSQSKLLLNTMKERSEGSGGFATRLRDRQMQQAEADLDAAREAMEVLEPLHINIQPCSLANTRQVLNLDGITFGYDPRPRASGNRRRERLR